MRWVLPVLDMLCMEGGTRQEFHLYRGLLHQHLFIFLSFIILVKVIVALHWRFLFPFLTWVGFALRDRA